jgi:ribosomal protein S18 acetylase RimI-like enzyme
MVDIREMVLDDYEVVFTLWTATEGIGLSTGDSRSGLEQFLRRNPGLSLVAKIDGRIVGTVLCGHDGRRGYLHHLAVGRQYRGRGIGKTLVQNCLSKLAALGVQKCHIFLHVHNAEGKRFWQKTRWQERPDVELMSRATSG